MRRHLLLILLLCSSCSAPQPAPAGPEFRTTATVKDIMDSIVDPSADGLWDAVAITISAAGTEEKAPHTDEEWAEVRRHGIRLLEATNLLLIPGRRIAKPGEKAENPNVELAPEQIETLVNQDRDSWMKFAHGLHDATQVALKAIDEKNSEALLYAGDGIDKACESCHLKYWYPNEAKKQ